MSRNLPALATLPSLLLLFLLVRAIVIETEDQSSKSESIGLYLAPAWQASKSKS